MKALVLALALSASGAAQAADWSFEFTPYVWGASMDGSVGAGELPTVSVDASFSDILKNLDAGIMGAFEARNGRWGVLLDAVYMKLEHSGTATRAHASAGAALEVKQASYALALAYRLGQDRAPLDVVGGLRRMDIEASADIEGSLFAQAGSVQRSASRSWTDPYVGLRALQPLAERWTLVSYADIGGFGVGSDFTWQALLGINYEFSKAWVGKAGYRMMGVDYDKDGFAYDMFYSGLYLGLGIRF